MFADKFARKLKRISQDFSNMSARDRSEGLSEMSLYEQSGVLKDEWERYIDT